MKIEALNEFLLLAETLNFTEAAKNAYVSQPALSAHIANLEKELDVRLFKRSHHSVSLTKAGKIFLRDAQIISTAHQSALQHLAQYKDGLTMKISIGFLLGSFGSFLPLVCNRYRKIHPKVEFCFRELDINEMQSKLNNEEVNLCFTLFTDALNGEKYERAMLYQDRYKLAVPYGHRLSNKKRVTIDDLRSEVVIAPRINLQKNSISQIGIKFHNAGVDVRYDESVTDAASLMPTIVATNRVAVALDHLEIYGTKNIAFIPLEIPGLDLCAGIVWKRAVENQTVQSFVNFVLRETSGFSRKDFLSRDGEDCLPFPVVPN